MDVPLYFRRYLLVIGFILSKVAFGFEPELIWYPIDSPVPLNPSWSLLENEPTYITYRIVLHGFYYYVEDNQLRFDMANGSSLAPVGSPEIPFFFERTMVPADGVNSIGIKVSSSTTITNLPPLYPVPEVNLNEHGIPYEVYQFDKDAYSEDKWFPTDGCVLYPIGFRREQALAPFGVSPVQYNPVRNEYHILTSIAIRINSAGATEPRITDHTGFETAYYTPFDRFLIPSAPPPPQEEPGYFPNIYYGGSVPTHCDMLVVTGWPFIDNGVPSKELKQYLVDRLSYNDG